MKKIALLSLLLVAFFPLNASVLPYVKAVISTPASGSPQVVVNTANATAQITPPSSSLVYTDLTKKGVMTFGVDHHYPSWNSAFVAEITVTLRRYTSLTSSPLADTNVVLKVSYQPNNPDSLTFVDKSTFTFNNVEKYKMTITQIKVNNSVVTVLPNNLYLQGDVFVDRIYDFANQTSISPFSFNLMQPNPEDRDCDGIMDNLTISWDPIDGAEEYQLEWTYVNDYAGGVPTINFASNATRISTTKTNYVLTLAFDKGYICFRVRAVGRSKNSPYRYLFTDWTAPDGDMLAEDPVYYHVATPYDIEKNWQYSSTYAEEGKKKEVISFYDGSLRNRQMVTKINSDQNTIVGETIYDELGRPMIQVLPAPVSSLSCNDPNAETTLKYYPSFNQNSIGDAYSTTDFQNNSTSCTPVQAQVMGTSQGASQYYSPSNPNIQGSQAYVPDANGYPFSQVQYMPDNTGRVRSQGGVGQDFQLGSGHETKYFYAHPFQEQLDRLFGSEVGDAAHYQKNMVIDPNGQVSVSYLDQEGRVIATSLAGDAPGNLQALPSQDVAGPLTVDLFATDADQNTQSNVLSTDGMSKVFNQTFALSSESDVTIKYGLQIDGYRNDCLPQNVCFECVYDLQIHVKDLCGVEHAPSYLSNKLTGHFTTNTNGEIVFALTCDTTDYHPEFTIIDLPVGTYQVSKILSINEDALNYYLSRYVATDSTRINTCITDYADFLDIEQNTTDTNDCNQDITCAECVTNLGTIEAYIQNGGTAEAYQAEIDACNEPCKPVSYYETMRDILKADVLPGGQYGEYMDNAGNVNTSIYPLSVLNTPNSLPLANSNWKYPKYDVDTLFKNGYYEEDGVTLSRIYLSNVIINVSNLVSSSVPAVDGLAPIGVKVFLDNATNAYYTYPQYLNNVSDFVEYYMDNPFWSNSLVYCHPEYSILNLYKTYTVDNPSYNRSSEDFDAWIQSISTFSEALTEGILTGTPYTIVGDPYSAVDAMLQARVNNYITINNVSYSMFEIAALMTRCPNNTIGYQPTATCTAFGTNLGSNAAQNTAILNAEWMAFRGMYLALKQELQLKRALSLAISTPSSYAYNMCIGNENFNMFENGFYSSGGYGNSLQPCNASNYLKYKFKTIRFGNAAAFINNDPNQVAYQMYLQTGQCPVAFAFQNVLNQAAGQGVLDDASFSMNALSMTQALTMAVNNFEVTGPLPTLNWVQSTNTSSVLEAVWNDNSTAYATFRLVKNPASTLSYNWGNITQLYNLQFTQINGGLYEFTVDAKVTVGGIVSTEHLTGHTTLKIGNCSFPEECVLNDQGKAIEKMLKLLAMNSMLTSTTALTITNAPYATFYTQPLSFAINTNPTGSATFIYDPSIPGFKFFDNTSILTLSINTTNPTTFNLSNMNLIADVELLAGPNNSFKIKCFDASGAYLVTLECDAIRTEGTNAAVELGSCGLGESLLCHGLEYEVFDDLKELLKHEIFPSYGQYELMNSPYWTTTLNGLLTSSVTSIPGQVTTITGGKKLTFDFPDSCDLTLTTHTSAITFLNLVSVNAMHVLGPQTNGGGFFNFYLLVTYNNGTTNVNDTIFGTSCMKLQECDNCNENQQPVSYTASQLEAINYNLKVAGILVEDTTIISYTDYVALIDATNLRLGWDASNSNYLTPIEYQEYFDNSLSTLLAGYMEYATRYVDGVDDYLLLSDPYHYLDQYGSGDNLLANYDRYLEGVNNYNTNRSSYGFATVSVVSLAVFSQTIYSEDCSVYLSYLSDEWNSISTVLPLNNYPNAQAAMIDESQCMDLYNDYFNAYQSFAQAQSTGETCLDYDITMPLVPYQSFIDNNLCCSTFGIGVLTDYINSFSTSNFCPGPLPMIDDCTSPAVVDVSMCQDNWYLYTTYIDTFNHSEWAQNHESMMLDLLYPSFNTFLQMGYCDCVADYNTYLQTYINAAPQDSLPTPQSIDEFCGSTELEFGNTPCQQEYESYLHCVAEYNAKAMGQGQEYVIDLVTMQAFYDNNLCYCVDEYCSQLNMVLDGVQDFELMPDLYTFCTDNQEQPCVHAPDTLQFETFDIVFDDPCMEFYESNMENNAYINFINQVQNLQTEIAQAYIAHCMGALETMTMTYNEIEHHFTLYYYDQAGNLIKTVPPAGVHLLDINDPTIKQAIKDDRQNNSHHVITNHTMATSYVYNSLNQLVAQNMPDQDAMQLFEATAADGLPIGLNTTAIQMVDANQGYLTGYVATSTGLNGNRGYLYKTTNGGNNWVRVSNILGADLKEVAFTTSTIGYAVANDGMIVRTQDGGFTWDLINTYSSNVFDDFVALEVRGTRAYSMTSKGAIYLVSGNGLDSLIQIPSLPNGYTVVSYKDFTLQNLIPANGTVLYIATLSKSGVPNSDYILRRNGSSVSIEEFNVLDLKTAAFFGTNSGVVAGVDGNLTQISGSTTDYFQKLGKSGTVGTIDQLYMVNDQIGLARISENGNTVIRKTTNGGLTWANLSADFTNAYMTLVKQSATHMEVMIQGNASNKDYSVLVMLNTIGTTLSETNQTPNLTQNINLKAVTAFVDGSNVTYFGIGADKKAYRSNTVTSPASPLTYTLISSNALANDAKELVVLKNGSGFTVDVLTSVNDVYRLTASTMSATGIAFVSSGFSSNIAGLEKITISGVHYTLAYNKATNTLHGKGAGSTAVVNFTTLNVTSGSVIEDIKLYNDKLTLIGTKGSLFTSNAAISAVSGTPTISFDSRNKQAFTGLTSIATRGSKVIVTGENGLVAIVASGSSSVPFVAQAIATVEDIYASSYRSTSGNNYYGFAGTNGYFKEWRDISSVWNEQAQNFTTVGLSISDHAGNKTLRSIAVNGNAMYVVGDGGQIYYTPDITTSAFIPGSAQQSIALNSVCFIPSVNKAIAVGNQTEIERFTANFGTRMSSVFPGKLVDVNFETGQYGAVIGEKNFVRTTNQGALAWTVHDPNAFGTSTLTKVAARKNADGQVTAIVGASNNIYLSKSNGLTSSLTSAAVSDIQFEPTNRLSGYVAKGVELTTITLVESSNMFTASITSKYTGTNTINAIHVFDQGSVAMVGTNGMIHFYSKPGNTSYGLATVAGVTFNDVYFRDHKTGVAVGNNGKFYYLEANALNNTTHDITTAGVIPTAETTVDPVLNNLNFNIQAIAYNDLNHAVYGGSYTVSGDVTSKVAFVRSVKQERNLYSARFYYDRLGRIVVSQNSRQQGETKYSYTLYDGLGRVYEAGEKTENTSTKFTSIFGTYVGGTYVPTVVDDTKLATWLNTQATTTRKEVTRSYYDATNTAIATEISGVFAPDALTQRKRIVHVTYEAAYDGLDNTYDHATHYDYDIHGNVKTLIQDNRSIKTVSNIDQHRFKRTDYIYDLISGNVHRVDYQTGQSDQWHHTYEYDADNRITEVYTSTETPITSTSSTLASLQNEPVINPLWDQEAEYSYYAHGPLARTELGEEKVQGLDYVYTLQGWIKGVNSNNLNTHADPGQDGSGLSATHYVAADVFGYSLHYFTGDYYSSIGGDNSFSADQNGSDLEVNSSNLYNGNIARMVTTITDPNTRDVLPLGNAYRYDQLNRLAEARSFNNLDIQNNYWPNGGTEMYYNNFIYDANGNIQTQNRMDENNVSIDELTYHYETGFNGAPRNRLSYVSDGSGNTDPNELADQNSGNYLYDAEGRLIYDQQEEIDQIQWRVDGKVKKIVRSNGSQKKNVSFDYDAMGHRIAKHVYTSANVWEKSTYYVLDATGNVMSVYEHVNDNTNQVITYAQTEKHIYGSSRLGVNNEVVPLFGSQNATYSMKLVQHKIGQRTYELSNHLGNVLSIISDKVIPHDNNGTVDYYMADIRHSQDYSPFGVTLHGRDLSLSTTGNKPYRYGFQNQEEDQETGLVNFEFRMHDPRLGRFFAIDPMFCHFPWNSTYAFSENRLIDCIEYEGTESVYYEIKFKKGKSYLVKVRTEWGSVCTLLTSQNVMYHGLEYTICAEAHYNGEHWTYARVKEELEGKTRKEIRKYFENKEPDTDNDNPLQGAQDRWKEKMDEYWDYALAYKYSKALEEVVITGKRIKFSDLPATGSAPPKAIRFSQNSISGRFKNGKAFKQLTKDLKSGVTKAEDVEPIRIVEKDGLIYTLDNRRLKAFQDAGVNVNYVKVDYNSLSKREKRKFTTTNEGKTIKVRGG